MLVDLFGRTAVPSRAALVALGSHARQELCPGSDVDLLLVHDGRDASGVAPLADALWYPLWDAGLVVGHATRNVREAATIAGSDVQVLTSMLDVRHVAGDAALSAELSERIREVAVRRRSRLVVELADASERRRQASVADLLEPNLKEGAGGLRDVQSLGWAGWALGPPGGLDALVALGYLGGDDVRRLADARRLLLTLRVALHRVAGRRVDDLRLEEHDAVALAIGEPDADVMARRLALTARDVAWIVADVWDRLRATERGPLGRLGRRDRVLAPGVVLRDGRATLTGEVAPDRAVALRLGAAAAERGVGLDRGALAALVAAASPAWGTGWGASDRDDLIRLLRQGRRALPVLEAFDHGGLLSILFPPWARVRGLAQRNAYHRHTVDRHLLETVARCVELFEGEGFDGDVARGLERPELLALVALVHDVGKGVPGQDHAQAGAAAAADWCRRLGLDEDGTREVEVLVRHHLLLADVATRRDLSEEATAASVARTVGRASTLELLYLLTVADSLATGPAAWNDAKAALVRELFLKALHLLDRGAGSTGVEEQRRGELAALVGERLAGDHLDAMPPSYAAAFDAETMARHRELLDGGRAEVVWERDRAGRVVATVVAPDRRGMLAAAAGVFAVHGLSVEEVAAYTRADGMALEVFRLADEHGRLERGPTPESIASDIEQALGSDLDGLTSRVDERSRRYADARRPTKPPQPPEVVIDAGASDFATVVEVHADDRVGLLYRIARTLAGLGLDVHLAKASTVGDRVVDAFYVRDGAGDKPDAATLERLRSSLLEELSRA